MMHVHLKPRVRLTITFLKKGKYNEQKRNLGTYSCHSSTSIAERVIWTLDPKLGNKENNSGKFNYQLIAI